MFDNGRPSRQQELLIMGTLAALGLASAAASAATATEWGTLPADMRSRLSAEQRPVVGTSVFAALVGLATFGVCGVLYPLYGRGERAAPALRSSGAWAAHAAAAWVLWFAAATALSIWLGEPDCTPDAQGACTSAYVSQALVWATWLVASLHLASAALWYWKRNDVVPGAKPWRRSHVTAQSKLADDDDEEDRLRLHARAASINSVYSHAHSSPESAAEHGRYTGKASVQSH